MVYTLLVQMYIFFFCRQASPNVPFRFIDIQHLSGFGSQGRIDMEEAFCDVLMYRAFTNTKLFGGLAYRRVLLHNKIGNIYRSLFYVALQEVSPCLHCFYSL